MRYREVCTLRVLIIGESCYDVFIYGDVERLAPEAPVPILQKLQLVTNAGMASNVANNLRRMGCEVTLHTNEGWQSITKTRYVEDKSNHIFLRVDDEERGYGRCSLRHVRIEDYDCIIISDYNKGWLSPSQIEEIGRRAKLSILDTKKILGAWALPISYIKINENEYHRTQDVLTPEIVEKLIVTLGPRGAMYHGQIFSAPDVHRIDSCGAGDTFVAGLAFKLMQSGKIDEAINHANQCASQVIKTRGVGTLQEGLGG